MRGTRLIGFMILALAGASPVGAQESPRPEERPFAASAERLLRMRERLALTEEQVAQLEARRKVQVEARRAALAQRLELRSRIRAGQISRQEVRELLRQRMQARGREARGAGAAEVLTEAQRGKLMELRRSTEARRFRGQMRARMRAERGALERGWARRGPGLGSPGPRWDRGRPMLLPRERVRPSLDRRRP